MQLAINGGPNTFSDDADARCVWPRITEESKRAVLDQLATDISIYNRSGIFEEFEDAFASYHDRKYGLLSSSGTTAIFSMFEAINLLPGDEVICPVYTFHASVSPLIYTGAIPVFCDSDDEGNISLEQIRSKITAKTKAVVVTHMWGVPVRESQSIRELCDEKGIYLLEDCSHAHGASLSGTKVGSFGHAAAWSLQGQKIITGGEGGIMLTDDKSIYERALLQGHYNKRAKQEISADSNLHDYYLTGLGLKLRAHPLAIALAMQQFTHLDEFITQKQTFAEKFSTALKGYSFLMLPDTGNSNRQCSWYAYNILFDETTSHGVTREQFVDALHAEGLIEADIPGSTGLLNELPLFLRPDIAMPRLYTSELPQQTGFEAAKLYYDRIIKFPIWSFADEDEKVEKYIAGIKKVADFLSKNQRIKI